MEEITLSIGEKISIFRKRKGISRKQLAEILGVSPQTISNYENGVTSPETPMLSTIATVLDIKLDNILFEPDAEKKGSHVHKPRLTQTQMKNMF